MKTPHRPNPRVIKLVIDASQSVGGQNRLAEILGYQKANVSGWATGHRSCPIQAQVLMAAITGRDPSKMALCAMIQAEPDPERRRQLNETCHMDCESPDHHCT
jgi:DNA-binding transcriptional regulator YdaS (Cro superfamily)